jgi:hypothetical protein
LIEEVGRIMKAGPDHWWRAFQDKSHLRSIDLTKATLEVPRRIRLGTHLKRVMHLWEVGREVGMKVWVDYLIVKQVPLNGKKVYLNLRLET